MQRRSFIILVSLEGAFLHYLRRQTLLHQELSAAVTSDAAEKSISFRRAARDSSKVSMHCLACQHFLKLQQGLIVDK